MPDLAKLHSELKFTTDLADVKANVTKVREAVAVNAAEKTALYALLEACYSLCPHASKQTGYEWSKCNHCGKEWSW
jgi:hypothetical protein